MKITLIGHSTILIETKGKRLLTDPFFNSRGNAAYRRVAPPAMSGEELANVDLVLLSHSHFDHIDPGFLKALPHFAGGHKLESRALMIVPPCSVWLRV